MREKTEQPETDPSFRAGYVAILGAPNDGKSTLVNTLLGQKVSIVSRKPQTTRRTVLGILSGEDYQIVFLDTPGLLTPQYLLHEAMMGYARTAAADADMVCFMVDATDPLPVPPGGARNEEVAMSELAQLRKPVLLVVNKIDLVEKAALLPLIAGYARLHEFTEIHPVSALRNEGMEDLLRSLVAGLPRHPPYYPTDVVSSEPERFFVSEIIREKIFEKFRDEIPYSATVEILDFREEAGKKDLIIAEITVERDSQKGILIGKAGAAIRETGEAARKDIEKFLGRPVFLDLHVRVREGWRESPAWLRRLGYQ
jgi:GTP-binding protein Era